MGDDQGTRRFGEVTSGEERLTYGSYLRVPELIGLQTLRVAESREVTILADKSVPFSVVKKVMSTCTRQGYAQISLAVLQIESQTTQVSKL